MANFINRLSPLTQLRCDHIAVTTMAPPGREGHCYFTGKHNPSAVNTLSQLALPKLEDSDFGQGQREH